MQEFIEKYGQKLLTAIGEHIFYVVTAVILAAIVALTLAAMFSRFRRAAVLIMPLVSVFQTIPGIVFIGALMMPMGMTPETVITALTVYAVFPILKNAYQGFIEIDSSFLEAAGGCGMNGWQTFFRVEVPLAMPAIFSGIRMSAIYTVSWAILAAMIGQGGLGEFIYRGIDANVNEYIVIGSIPIAVLAILLRLFIDWLEKRIVSKGLQ